VSDQSAGVFDKIAQHIERLGSKRYALLALPQALIHQIKPE